VFFNVNAADAEKRQEVLEQVAKHLADRGEPGAVTVLLHSLAFGALRPYISDDPKEVLSQSQMEMTLDVMAHSLVYWTQELVRRNLMGPGGKIFAMTSSGGNHVWPTYGAVSAAKAHWRPTSGSSRTSWPPQDHRQLHPCGRHRHPALRKIPGNDRMIEGAQARNPHRRLTTPADVAEAIATLCQQGTHWVTGNVIGVDGGEDLTG